MAEWSNAAVLKTVDLHGSGGSNPSLSAQSSRDTALFFVMLIPPANLAGFFCLIAHLVNEFTECAIKQKQHGVLWYQHNNEKRGIANFVEGVTSSANREPQIATTLPRR